MKKTKLPKQIEEAIETFDRTARNHSLVGSSTTVEEYIEDKAYLHECIWKALRQARLRGRSEHIRARRRRRS